MVKKKRFPCGHVGLGRNFCHRCEAAQLLEEQLNAGKIDKKNIVDTKEKIAYLRGGTEDSKWKIVSQGRLQQKK